MSNILKLAPPYYAVIFSSTRTDGDHGYEATAQRMLDLASQQEGFLGVESARNEIGLTVSYWESMKAIQAWKQQLDHIQAQHQGREQWYQAYRVRIARVDAEYGFDRDEHGHGQWPFS